MYAAESRDMIIQKAQTASDFLPRVRLLLGVQTARAYGARDQARRRGAVIPLARGPVRARFGAIRSRRHPNQFAEHSSEVTLIAETHLLADVRHRFVGSLQQRLRPLHAAVIQICHEGLAGGALEEAHKVRFAHPEDMGSLLHLSRLAEVFFQMLEQRTKPFECTLLAPKCLHRSGI